METFLEELDEAEEQLKPKVTEPDFFSVNVSLPETPLSPDQEPVPEQLDAFDVDQVNVTSSPVLACVAVDEKVMPMLGADGVGAAAGEPPPPPPPPQAEIIKMELRRAANLIFIFVKKGND